MFFFLTNVKPRYRFVCFIQKNRRIVRPSNYSLTFSDKCFITRKKKNFKQITNVCAKIWKRAFCQCCFAIFQDSVIKFMSFLFHFCTWQNEKVCLDNFDESISISNIFHFHTRRERERKTKKLFFHVSIFMWTFIGPCSEYTFLILSDLKYVVWSGLVLLNVAT